MMKTNSISIDIDELNRKLPISLRELEYIINRVCDRYPAISKYEVSIIVRGFFEVSRWLIVNGHIISIHNFVNHMRLFSYERLNRGFIQRIFRIKLSTPRAMKQ